MERIEREHGRNDDRKLAMLQHWVETNPKASWNDLAEALKKMPQHQSLSGDIEKIHKLLLAHAQGKCNDTYLWNWERKNIITLCMHAQHGQVIGRVPVYMYIYYVYNIMYICDQK